VTQEPTPGTAQIVRRIAGVEIVFDGEGFFKNPSLWSEEAARVLAEEAGVRDLNEKQWNVIHFLRKYYSEQGKAPLNHKIKNGTGLSLMELEALFPGGIKYGARRLAGLPNPKACR
jgi:tRNA 2-thiouridine synthesizing protein E